MNELQRIALRYLYPLLIDLGSVFGWDSDTIVTTYWTLYDELTGAFWYLFAPPLALLCGLWLIVKYAEAAIPGWITDAVSFVRYQVIPLWNWVVWAVQWLSNFASGIGTTIWNTATAVFWALIAPFQNALNWLTTTLSAFGSQLLTFIQNVPGQIYAAVVQFWDTITAPLRYYWNVWTVLWNNFNQTLTAFLSDPGGYIANLLLSWITALLAPFRPLLDFLAWWQNKGAHYLVAFVDDPAQFVFDMVAPRFLSWLAQLIAENW